MITLNEVFVKYAILFFLWSEYLWELYLSIRQHKKGHATTEVPPELRNTMTKETFSKARLYMLAKSKFGMVKDTFSVIESTVIIYFGILPKIWDYAQSLNPYGGEVLTSCLWLFILTTILTIVDLPLTIYNTFVLEENFGFNKQTSGFFIWDKIKAYILSQVFTMMISSVIVVTIQSGGAYFFVWLWIVVCLICFIMYAIYPSFIAPLFDKYTPLPEGELRTQIESLASQLKFPLTQLYVVEGSKRSSHSNAYFYGLFNSKRIVLFDTLLAKDDGTGCKNDEILAVLSHELGHWHYNHIVKNFLALQINLFLLFAGFSYLFKYPAIYKAIGFYKSQPVLVGLYIVVQYVMLPYNACLSFLLTCLSRRFEFQADSFAIKLGKGSYLINALVQLNKDNLGFPIYDYLYSSWHHSHPPLLERIDVIKTALQKKD
ncbi:CAAX prenyl protease 1 homolog [Tribolium castaneum]|uniref:CAAX prenyl protease n=1 Tax=Tribolium castaneum TaxID=7070 RepID=D6WA54_TRICA|nr:PREDICTED: CAAX prenyl protease 1 homolog [Tribolium castaneum]EEZ98057.1 CAAX prenyl protease 1 homolog-like Protein [Tribolium castaneum]|eukprot:XP_968656.1 PREDICTED: CAAX prenyl protease 1 homolog [Tribolium castaneum]